ncbi:MAG: bacterial Ig-like domain-containing protein [Clostridia bacterium]|nr:bacterial Ig-like domain-containing protein [Clostridia bacterium]
MSKAKNAIKPKRRFFQVLGKLLGNFFKSLWEGLPAILIMAAAWLSSVYLEQNNIIGWWTKPLQFLCGASSDGDTFSTVGSIISRCLLLMMLISFIKSLFKKKQKLTREEKRIMRKETRARGTSVFKKILAAGFSQVGFLMIGAGIATAVYAFITVDGSPQNSLVIVLSALALLRVLTTGVGLVIQFFTRLCRLSPQNNAPIYSVVSGLSLGFVACFALSFLFPDIQTVYYVAAILVGAGLFIAIIFSAVRSRSSVRRMLKSFCFIAMACSVALSPLLMIRGADALPTVSRQEIVAAMNGQHRPEAVTLDMTERNITGYRISATEAEVTSAERYTFLVPVWVHKMTAEVSLTLRLHIAEDGAPIQGTFVLHERFISDDSAIFDWSSIGIIPNNEYTGTVSAEFVLSQDGALCWKPTFTLVGQKGGLTEDSLQQTEPSNSDFTRAMHFNTECYPIADGEAIVAAYTDLLMPALTELRVDVQNAKTVFSYGTPFSYEGISVVAHYGESYSEEVPLSECTVSAEGFDATASGEYTVTVSARGISGSYTVWVAERVPSALMLDYSGCVTEFTCGTEFHTEGLLVSLVYEDGGSRTLSAEEYEVTSAVDTEQEGTYTVNVSAFGFTQSYEVIYEPKPIEAVKDAAAGTAVTVAVSTAITAGISSLAGVAASAGAGGVAAMAGQATLQLGSTILVKGGGITGLKALSDVFMLGGGQQAVKGLTVSVTGALSDKELSSKIELDHAHRRYNASYKGVLAGTVSLARLIEDESNLTAKIHAYNLARPVSENFKANNRLVAKCYSRQRLRAATSVYFVREESKKRARKAQENWLKQVSPASATFSSVSAASRVSDALAVLQLDGVLLFGERPVEEKESPFTAFSMAIAGVPSVVGVTDEVMALNEEVVLTASEVKEE